jgi:outer membrane protein assembly factor BamB
MSVHPHHSSSAVRAALALCVALVSLVARAEDWPQFRGPNCSGISRGTKPLPVKFSATENLRWSADAGDGVGGAVIAAGRLFVSGMTGPETVTLFAFEADSGKPLWRRDWATGPLAEIHATNSQASATPAADADRVYFYFSTLGLLAVDAKTGADAWKADIPTPFFVFKWGPGMSPVLYGDLVLFCQDDDIHPALRAYDKVTGKLRWEDDRLDMAVNYSHPVVCSSAGRDEIVIAGTGRMIGYDPATGARRWFAKGLLRNIKTTPVCVDGVVYVSVQSSAIANQWLAAVDRDDKVGNKDNKLDKQEIQAYVGKQPIPPEFFARTFDRGDANKDGFLEGRELDLAFLHPDNFAGADFTASGDAAAEQFILAVRGGGRGDVTASHVLWRHKTRNTDHIVSPFVADGRMFLVKEGGVTTVFQTGTGEPARGPKRIGLGGRYFASPVSGDGKIYVAAENGNIAVLKDGPDYEELALNDTGETIVATPAISDGRLFVRTRGRVLCFAEERPAK